MDYLKQEYGLRMLMKIFRLKELYFSKKKPQNIWTWNAWPSWIGVQPTPQSKPLESFILP